MRNPKESKNSKNGQLNGKTSMVDTKSKLNHDLVHGGGHDDVNDNNDGKHGTRRADISSGDYTVNPEQRIKSPRLIECDFNEIERKGKYFEEKFNDIIAKCVNEVNKIANLDLQTWTEGRFTVLSVFTLSLHPNYGISMYSCTFSPSVRHDPSPNIFYSPFIRDNFEGRGTVFAWFFYKRS